MPREKKKRVAINARLSKNVIDRLDTYCENCGATKTFVIEKALSTYLDKQEEILQIAENLANK